MSCRAWIRLHNLVSGPLKIPELFHWTTCNHFSGLTRGKPELAKVFERARDEKFDFGQCPPFVRAVVSDVLGQIAPSINSRTLQKLTMSSNPKPCNCLHVLRNYSGSACRSGFPSISCAREIWDILLDRPLLAEGYPISMSEIRGVDSW
jgi:hypothetical protein